MRTPEQEVPAKLAPFRRWTGVALSVLAALFFILDAGGKLIAPEFMIADTPPLGLPSEVGFYRLVGLVLAICTVLYVWPRTSLLGAVLLTGFLGGAVAVNLRAGMPLFSNTLFGIYVGALMWTGILLRRPEISAMLVGNSSKG